jgi:hypothetical protein
MGMVAGALVALTAIGLPLGIAAAQETENELCDLATPAVRDVVQDAPIISAILNLDPALPDATIDANRANAGCSVPAPKQTQAEARAEVCAVLVEARIEDLVEDLNNPDATTALETVRPGLGQILAQARVQMKCDTAQPEPTQNPAPVQDTDGGGDTSDEKDAPQVPRAPRNGVNTGAI